MEMWLWHWHAGSSGSSGFVREFVSIWLCPEWTEDERAAEVIEVKRDSPGKTGECLGEPQGCLRLVGDSRVQNGQRIVQVSGTHTRVHWAVPLIATGAGSGSRFRSDARHGLMRT